MKKLQQNVIIKQQVQLSTCNFLPNRHNYTNMVGINKQKIEEILNRGVDEIIVKQDLEKKLKSGKKLRVKFGIDPTSPDLHLGHTVPLRKLKQFQDLGHKVVLVIGDFTATIGDPSGRMTQRIKLSEKEVKKNMVDYIKQAGKVLDLKKTEIKYNNEWYKKKGAYFLMELFSKFTLARVSERDDFKKRIKEDIDISILELIYPLLQGYDSVELKSDVEIGGRDQKFNLLMGRRVQKRYGQLEQDIMTLPLLEGIDGVQKMSKSFGNYIGISEKPSKMYGGIMSISDELMWKYFNLLTDIPLAQVEKMKMEKQKNSKSPREIKAILAKEIVKMYHGQKEAQKAEEEFNKTFKEGGIPSQVEVFKTNKGKYPILDLLFDSKLAESKSDAKRVIEGGGVEVQIKNQKSKIKNWQEDIIVEDDMVIKFGKRKFIRIKKI